MVSNDFFPGIKQAFGNLMALSKTESLMGFISIELHTKFVVVVAAAAPAGVSVTILYGLPPQPI